MKFDATTVATWWLDYESGKSVREVTAIHKISAPTLLAAFREHGYQTRSRSAGMVLAHERGPLEPRAPRASDEGEVNRFEDTKGRCFREEVCSWEDCRFWLEGGECALKRANEGAMTGPEVGELLGFSKQYVERIEQQALVKLRRRLGPDAFAALLPEAPLPRSSRNRGDLLPKLKAEGA